MRFQRRDGILVAGVGLVAAGLAPFMGVAYVLAIAAGVFFGIKAFSEWRQRQILGDAAFGICAECGGVLAESGCPQCGRRGGDDAPP